MACNSCGNKSNKPFQATTKHIDKRSAGDQFVRARLAICSVCEQNVSGVCSALKEEKPDMDCKILIGAELTESYCPKGKWNKHDPEKYPRHGKCQICAGITTLASETCKQCVNKLENKYRKLARGIGTSPRVDTKNSRLGVNEVTKQMQDAVIAAPARRRRRSAFTALYNTTTFLTVNDLASDAVKLASILPSDTKAIVGVARSGMTPANIVATMLHLPLLAVRQTKHDVIEVGNGWRMGGSSHIATARNKKVAVIDDTVMTGNSFRHIDKLLQKNFSDYVTCGIYVNPLATKKPDLMVHELAWPHILEWNLFNSVLSPNCATDFDGVLCHDCQPWQDDDGPNYSDFIANAVPRYLSRKTPIPLIITARIEKYREPTVKWLQEHGVKFGRLIMHPAKSTQERRRDDIAAWKASHFEKWAKKHKPRPAPLMFIESEPAQAKRINEITGRLVTCPSNAKVYGNPKKY